MSVSRSLLIQEMYGKRWIKSDFDRSDSPFFTSRENVDKDI